MKSDFAYVADVDDRASPFIVFAAFIAFTAYLVVASLATVVFPPAFVVFLAPMVLMIVAAIPQGQAAPKRLIMPLLYAGAVLLPLWPVYIHLKLGPLPIITPPRILLYLLSAIWIADMLTAPLRRAQFLVGLRNSRSVSGFVLGLFAVSALSVPMAEGRVLAAQEFFRQAIIWLLPFCVAVTYVRRTRELHRLVLLLVIGAVFNACLAILEKATGHLVAQVLSPLITGNAEWLQIAASQKIRDGVFRAQGTHTHPLSLGEYVSVMAPFAIMFAAAARPLAIKAAWGAAAFILIAGALATSSRGALLAVSVSLIATALVLIHRFLQRQGESRLKPVAGAFVLALIAAAPVGYLGAKNLASGAGGVSTSNSSQARLDQIEQAWPKILKRPVGGYGTGRAVRILGFWGRSLTIDNYYLTLALDYGFPGPILFGSILIAVILASNRRSRAGPVDHQMLYVGFIVAMIAFGVTRTIVSMAGNLSFLYILFGAFAGAAAGSPRRKHSPRTKDDFYPS
ncbi:MAG: O-antigen ligase family protein [Pseudomonadota bacterium]